MDAFSLLLILGLTFGFGYLNGVNSAGSIIATVVSSRALNPRLALILAIICMCSGPFILGAAVVGTISSNLIDTSAISSAVVVASLGGAILWVTLAAWMRLPSSTTHAFIGSLIGAAWMGFGFQAIVTAGVVKVMIALFLSPILGTLTGFILVKLSYRFSESLSATPTINRWFKKGQIFISLLVAVSFGSNDGQKLIGIVALGIMSIHHTELVIPVWAAGFSALAMASGTLIGSQRIAGTLGRRLYKVQPIHGFGAQTASSIVLLSASILGSPISGSQVITSAIIGAGSAERVQMIRWGVYQQIFTTWLLTIPLSALVGAVLYLVCAFLQL